MLTRVLWACVGFMSFSGIAGASRADGPAEEDAQVAGAEQSSAEVARFEEAEGLEAEVSSPPMAMDDPGTPGRQGIELNFVGTLARVGETRGTESLLDANFGIGDRLQLKFERPYVTTGRTGGTAQKGLGATEIGVKWRFVDRNGLELAVYPQYEFNDAFLPKDEAGNPEESEGHSAYFPLLISKTVARGYTVAANLGYRHNTDHSTNDRVVALGLGRVLGSNGRILSEVYSERDEHFRSRQTEVRVGVVQLLFPKRLASTGFEFPGYAALGRSVGRTEEGEAVTSFTFGVSVIKKPIGE